jgi:hypothetical protein
MEGMSAGALERVITAMAGPHARPRPDQVTAVEALVERRRRVLVVQATGWGKSAVYWAATAALRAAGGGPTLVVSPLLALMRDQIAAAAQAGLRAATVNSTNVEDWDEVLTELGAGRCSKARLRRCRACGGSSSLRTERRTCCPGRRLSSCAESPVRGSRCASPPFPASARCTKSARGRPHGRLGRR